MELLGTERRWEDKVKVKLKEYGEDLSQRYFVHKKFYNKWPGIESGPLITGKISR